MSQLPHQNRRFIFEIPFFISYMGSNKLFFLITGLAVASILEMLPSAILSYLIAVLLFLAAYKVAFEVMLDVADGHFAYQDKYSFGLSEMIGFKAMTMPIIQLLIVIFLSKSEPALSTSLLLVTLFLTPAFLMLLSQTDHVLSALNPIDLLEIVKRLGVDYWLLFIFMAMLGGLNMLLQNVLVNTMPLWLENVVLSFILYYLLIFSFLAMGYVIYHHADELDHTPHDIEDIRGKDPLDHDDPIRKRIETLLAEGDAQTAMAMITDLQKEGRDDLQALAHQAQNALQISQRMSPKDQLCQMITRQDMSSALKFWLDYYDDGHRLTPKPEHIQQLIMYCHQKKQQKPMLTLIKGLDKQYPNEPQLIVDCFYLAAQALYQNKQTEQAVKILQSMIKKYSDKADTKALRSYYQGLQKMGKT